MHAKRAGLLILLIAGLLALYGSALAGEQWYTRDNTHLRDAATTGGKSLMIVRGGQPVEVLGKSGEWYRVKYGGTTGYIRSDLLVQLSRAGYLPLELGNECPQVEALQERLKDLGYFSGRCNGEFGEDTREAVLAFQKRNRIDADGIAGGATQELLYSSKAKAASGATAGGSGSSGTNTQSGSTSSGAGVLKKGDTGRAVTQMQQRLRELGYIAFSADGEFGTGTENAVIAFQKNNGLTADGIAGSATLNKLNSSSARSAASSGSSGESGVLKQGDTGSAVRSLQQRLKELGYITFAPDGIYGSGTERGVRYFQDRNRLKVDGIAGASTLSLMNSSAAIASATSPSAGSSVGTATVLKRGDTGSAVAAMQQRLKDLGYLGAADGSFGSATRNAVIAFQKNNGLTADGIAGATTLAALNSSGAKAAGSSGSSSGSGSSGGTSSGPSASNVRLLHFFDKVKPNYKSGTIVTVYDPSSKYSWKLRFMSMGRHADSEPLTAEDTAMMNKAFGNVTTWSPKAVWIKFPDGVWSMATMHNTPHLSGTIKGNNFDGHLCVHFLRDMAECKQNDPQYGVQNQVALRAAWKALTGETVD